MDKDRIAGATKDFAGKVEGAAVWDSPKMLGVLEPFLADNGIVKTSTH